MKTLSPPFRVAVLVAAGFLALQLSAGAAPALADIAAGTKADVDIEITSPPGVHGQEEKDPLATSSVSGYIYEDVDGSGKREDREMDARSATVTITGKDAAGESVSRTVQTDHWGEFAVTKLPPGTYDIDLGTAPSVVKLGMVDHGAADASAGKTARSGVTGIILSGRDSAFAYEFGIVRGTLGPEVPRESGLAGVVFVVFTALLAGAAGWVSYCSHSDVFWRAGLGGAKQQRRHQGLPGPRSQPPEHPHRR